MTAVVVERESEPKQANETANDNNWARHTVTRPNTRFKIKGSGWKPPKNVVFTDTETKVSYYYEPDGVYEFPTRQPLYLYSNEESESTDDEESESENNNASNTADFPISENEKTSDTADHPIANRRSDRLNKQN